MARNRNDIVEILQRIRYIIGEASRLYESGCNIEIDELMNCLYNLSRIRNTIGTQTYNQLGEIINDLVSLPESRNENLNYVPEKMYTGERGRPALNITRSQLIFLFNEGDTMHNMARKLNCSVSTIKKRLYEENIFIRSKYTRLSDEELKDKMRTIQANHSNCGSEMMAGYLRSEGIFVQRSKIRQFLNDIDQISVARRWTATIRRRRYNVPTPNSLWHMDAHCKLSRWGFIIHGCIDGYSRLIIYLSCTTSIQAEPVVRLFMRAYGEYGIPSRVRSDHGYENIFVALLMNLLRGMNRGSHITGKSVHNQRIERLWVDVYKEVVDAVCNELYELEDANKLDPDNNVHRYCCQYVYLPLINMRLKSFMDGWNLHKIRTANRNTPRQIWLNGMLNNHNSNHTAITEVFNPQDDLLTRVRNSLQSYGINTVINPDVVTEPSLFTAHVDITNEKKLRLEEILLSDLATKEKYILCVQSITS